MTHSDESALPPDHPEVRRASLLLSTLLLTPDKGLESYRRSRCADPELELDHLRRARQILCAVGFAIGAPEPARWQRIERVWRELRGDAARAPEGPKPSSFEAATQRAEPARRATQSATKEAVDETAAVDLSVLAAAEAALPFSGHGPAPPPVARELGPRPRDDLDQTAVVTDLPANAALLPFERSRPPSPGISVAQYARLCAECEAMPDRVAEIRARYGLASAEAHRSLELDWKERLSADVQLRKQFDAHSASIGAWIRRERG